MLAILSCPHAATHGNPYRYCPYCSWREEHAHDLEAQLVCESCGHRESLPPGSVVLSPEQVAQVREERATCEPIKFATAYGRGYAAGLDFVLALLDAPEEEK